MIAQMILFVVAEPLFLLGVEPGIEVQMNDRFPGFEWCMALMRNSDPETQEEGFFTLLPHAAEFVPELIDEFAKEENRELRFWLMELIVTGKLPIALEFLAGQLRRNDRELRRLAMMGLQMFDSHESHALLWNARSFTFDSPEETEAFRSDLREILNKRNLKL